MRNVRRLQMTKADRGLQRYFSKEKWNWQDFFFLGGVPKLGIYGGKIGETGMGFP
jgi:hypothetical protein